MWPIRGVQWLTLPLIQLTESLPFVLPHESGVDEVLQTGEALAESPADCSQGDAVGERDIADDSAAQQAASPLPSLLCGIKTWNGITDYLQNHVKRIGCKDLFVYLH